MATMTERSKPKRFSVITIRRTSRFTSYGIYDEIQRGLYMPHNGPWSTRDKKAAENEARRLNES